MKIKLNELNSYLNEPIAVFMGTASYEKRCLEIYRAIRGKCSQSIFFRNTQTGLLAKENLQILIESSGGNGLEFPLDLDDPSSTARALSVAVLAIEQAPDGHVFIDSTTFTHEQLLILFRILDSKKINRKFIFGYTGAAQYSINTDSSNAWLSRGVSEVRSVLGYPGNPLPSKRLHLIILMGFEYERARAVVEKLDPNELSLGVGERSQSVSEHHYKTNRRFFEDMRNFVTLRTDIGPKVSNFSFSCVDPVATENEIMRQIDRLPDHNTVICPMNTKISTLGTAILACKKHDVQVCYSRPIEYNEEGYSTPSDHVTLFEWVFS